MRPEQLLPNAQNNGEVHERIYKILRGGVSLGDGIHSDNVNGVWANVVTPGAPNTEFVVPHSLGRIPVAFDVKKKNAACDVYASTTAWTNKNIYLKATVATVSLRLFIH